MVVIASSLGALLVFQFDRPVIEALSLSLTLFCTMLVLHTVYSRDNRSNAATSSVEQLEERLAEIDDDVLHLEGRLSGMEKDLPRKVQKEVDPLFAEVEVIGSLVKQMAEAMADMEGRIDDQGVALEDTRRQQALLQAPQLEAPQSALAEPALTRPASPSAYAARMAAESLAPQDLDVGLDEDGEPARSTSAPRMPRPDPQLAAEIRAAIDASRVDLYLQPIVTLPQRRVRYYEAYTRLRTLEGNLLEPTQFIAEAERSGQMPAIDNILLFRSLQIIKRLTARNRDAALFCNLSPSTLVDEDFFPGFLEFVRANETYTDQLIFEFAQADVAAMGLIEHESLAALAELGFRFSVDRITDLRMDFRALADKGFRFAKVNAARLISQDENVEHGNIHPADFGALLGRYGIELIPDHVETEAEVLELIEMELRSAQGYLFSAPRPVRADVLQGALKPRAVNTA
ncbi:EAL domain-containing protein [Polycladidibacter hongkongensis]|uniref:EAL domain-containing protein n=1 Tax=Polycladidibacter hongkongensis TaxID=1647556 RepID=UPI000A41C8EB|nr:EAL domain-containing protein [Pseudovibrio hongkongensis]